MRVIGSRQRSRNETLGEGDVSQDWLFFSLPQALRFERGPTKLNVYLTNILQAAYTSMLFVKRSPGGI